MLGNNLEEIRINKGFTRKTLSLASGVSASTIGLIEWGVSPHPRITTLEKLAAALNVTVNDFIK